MEMKDMKMVVIISNVTLNVGNNVWEVNWAIINWCYREPIPILMTRDRAIKSDIAHEHSCDEIVDWIIHQTRTDFINWTTRHELTMWHNSEIHPSKPHPTQPSNIINFKTTHNLTNKSVNKASIVQAFAQFVT